MSEPIFILGCHRSGTSVVAGLLHRACGVSMGELMPPTEDNPMGYFEALGVVDAHRDILAQMERDWTCPPTNFRPGLLDLTALEEQVKIHADLPGVWAMKDPRSMFLFPAWSHLGVDRVRLIAVVRPPADTVRSIEKRDQIRQDRAEAIVDVYLRRLLEIAEKVPLPIVHFPGEGDSLTRQVRDLAASLDLPWDEEIAREVFDAKLVRNQSPLRDFSPTYERLVDKTRYPKKTPPINLHSLKLGSEPEWALETHIGVRYAQHRNQLWEMAHFSADPNPHIAEVLLEGARRGGLSRPNVGRLSQVEVTTPLAVGATLMRDVGRTHGVIAHGILAGRSASEVEFFLRSVYINTDPLAELLVDVPDPQGSGLLNITPPPQDHPRPALVQEIATHSGWEHIATERLSPGRSGMFFRKKVLTDTELVPVVTDLIASLHRIRAMEDRLASTLSRLEDGVQTSPRPDQLPAPEPGSREAEKSRADKAEREFERLRSRRSVRMALALARPARGIFQAVRSWKNR